MIGNRYTLPEDIAPGLPAGTVVEVAVEDDDGLIVITYQPGKAIVDGGLQTIEQAIHHRIPAGSLDGVEFAEPIQGEMLPADVDIVAPDA